MWKSETLNKHIPSKDGAWPRVGVDRGKAWPQPIRDKREPQSLDSNPGFCMGVFVQAFRTLVLCAGVCRSMFLCMCTKCVCGQGGCVDICVCVWGRCWCAHAWVMCQALSVGCVGVGG